MPKKKPIKGKPEVHADLEGMEIKINEFGEIIGNLGIDRLNTFLNENVEDKKLIERKQNMNRPIRILIAKVGLDGHDRGAKVIASSLRDQGMEVIYTGLRQTPEMVVRTAIQEDVDAIGISTLSGAHMTIFPKLIQVMKQEGLDNVLITGGGIIPEEDMDELRELGIGELFPPATGTKEIADYITTWVEKNRRF